MRLAIITTVNMGDPETPKLVSAIPITSDELADAIVERVSRTFWFLTSKPEIQKAIRESVASIELETKMKTIKLGMEHG